MVKFSHKFNVAARTQKEALKISRKVAKGIGMVATKIKATKKGTARVKGKQVWNITASLRTRKRGRK